MKKTKKYSCLSIDDKIFYLLECSKEISVADLVEQINNEQIKPMTKNQKENFLKDAATGCGLICYEYIGKSRG